MLPARRAHRAAPRQRRRSAADAGPRDRAHGRPSRHLAAHRRRGSARVATPTRSRRPGRATTWRCASTAPSSARGAGPMLPHATADRSCAACCSARARSRSRPRARTSSSSCARPTPRRRSARSSRKWACERASRSARGQHVVYIKGQEEIVALLGLMGANRGVLELETQMVGRDVRSRAEPAAQRGGGEPGANGPRGRSPAGRHRSAGAGGGSLPACHPHCARPPRPGAACPTPISTRSHPPSASAGRP